MPIEEVGVPLPRVSAAPSPHRAPRYALRRAVAAVVALGVSFGLVDGLVWFVAPIVEASVPAQLPGGGRQIFPEYRLVGFSGLDGAPSLGELRGDLDRACARIKEHGAPLAGGRRVMPLFELVSVVTTEAAGRDRLHRSRVDHAVVDRYLTAARRCGAMLVLNIQPGASDVLQEVRALEPFLREPDVGLALDAEWALEPGQVPGATFGHLSGQTIDAVSAYLARIVQEGNLPEKLLMYHLVAPSLTSDIETVKERAGVVLLASADGIGTAEAKAATLRAVRAEQPAFVHSGIKLFFSEDRAHGPLMTPEQVLRLSPAPEYVTYE